MLADGLLETDKMGRTTAYRSVSRSRTLVSLNLRVGARGLSVGSGLLMAVILFPCWLCPTVAYTETGPATAAPARFWDRPLSFNGVLGMATPTGEIGGTAEYSFSKRIAAGAGAGVSPSGIQTAAYGRLRLRVTEDQDRAYATSLVGAFSTGPYAWFGNGGDDGDWKERAYWIQLGLDYEILDPRTRFVIGFGLAMKAGSSNVQRECLDACPHEPLAFLPTLHITFGFN